MTIGLKEKKLLVLMSILTSLPSKKQNSLPRSTMFRIFKCANTHVQFGTPRLASRKTRRRTEAIEKCCAIETNAKKAKKF